MDPTQFPIEPTQQVTPSYSGDEWTKQRFPEYLDYMYIMPPPPPPPKSYLKQTIVVITLLVAALLVFGASILLYLASNRQRSDVSTVPTAPIVPTVTHNPVATSTSLPTAVVTPTTANPDYTASDIFKGFHMAGLRPNYVQYGQTIWSWSSDLYYVSVHATSSATFTDDSGCTGYCSPQDLGLWVYSSPSEAHTAYTEVGNDETSRGSIPMIGTPTEYVRGRCLLLGASLDSVYVQVMEQDCV